MSSWDRRPGGYDGRGYTPVGSSGRRTSPSPARRPRSPPPRRRDRSRSGDRGGSVNSGSRRRSPSREPRRRSPSRGSCRDTPQQQQRRESSGTRAPATSAPTAAFAWAPGPQWRWESKVSPYTKRDWGCGGPGCGATNAAWRERCRMCHAARAVAALPLLPPPSGGGGGSALSLADAPALPPPDVVAADPASLLPLVPLEFALASELEAGSFHALAAGDTRAGAGGGGGALRHRRSHVLLVRGSHAAVGTPARLTDFFRQFGPVTSVSALPHEARVHRAVRTVACFALVAFPTADVATHALDQLMPLPRQRPAGRNAAGDAADDDDENAALSAGVFRVILPRWACEPAPQPLPVKTSPGGDRPAAAAATADAGGMPPAACEVVFARSSALQLLQIAAAPAGGAAGAAGAADIALDWRQPLRSSSSDRAGAGAGASSSAAASPSTSPPPPPLPAPATAAAPQLPQPPSAATSPLATASSPLLPRPQPEPQQQPEPLLRAGTSTPPLAISTVSPPAAPAVSAEAAPPQPQPPAPDPPPAAASNGAAAAPAAVRQPLPFDLFNGHYVLHAGSGAFYESSQGFWYDPRTKLYADGYGSGAYWYYDTSARTAASPFGVMRPYDGAMANSTTSAYTTPAPAAVSQAQTAPPASAMPPPAQLPPADAPTLPAATAAATSTAAGGGKLRLTFAAKPTAAPAAASRSLAVEAEDGDGSGATAAPVPQPAAAAPAPAPPSAPVTAPAPPSLPPGIAFACALCQRGFPTADALHKHEAKSELHRQNLAAAAADDDDAATAQR